ncbi:MAG: 1,2-phenylacetyl-CoA epoxidase subunit PaaD [Acidimicrobiia bacterium]
MTILAKPDLALAARVAGEVADPEIPVLTISDLGVLRDVSVEGAVTVVTITPTYSGCPAMRQISDDIEGALEAVGFEQVEVRTVQHPAWTTDWMTEAGKSKLAAFGIAPPGREILCPNCSAGDPRILARFGSTACKALMVCSACGEPFDYFKEF